MSVDPIVSASSLNVQSRGKEQGWPAWRQNMVRILAAAFETRSMNAAGVL
jgi:hypothetical protein